jgi:hypothetical protein
MRLVELAAMRKRSGLSLHRAIQKKGPSKSSFFQSNLTSRWQINLTNEQAREISNLTNQ